MIQFSFFCSQTGRKLFCTSEVTKIRWLFIKQKNVEKNEWILPEFHSNVDAQQSVVWSLKLFKDILTVID